MVLKPAEVLDTIVAPVVYIRYKGIWDMQGMYQVMADWFKRRKYKFYEKIYKHKHPSPFGVERQYIWRAERKETEYTNFIIDIYYHIYDAYNIDVMMPDGSSKKMVKGRLWMEFKASAKYDWEARYDENAFYAELKNFLNKYVFRKKWEQFWFHHLYTRELHQLHALVKEQLKLSSQGNEFRYKVGVHR